MPTLTWLNDDEARRAARDVPYRLLEEDPALSYGDPQTQNMLIQGDNLAALKSLLTYYAGQIKCIFIVPPYNTGSAFEHYDDSLEHSTWLTMMYPRLELLRDFLAEDESIWVSIDDNEGQYLKVLMVDKQTCQVKERSNQVQRWWGLVEDDGNDTLATSMAYSALRPRARIMYPICHQVFEQRWTGIRHQSAFCKARQQDGLPGRNGIATPGHTRQRCALAAGKSGKSCGQII